MLSLKWHPQILADQLTLSQPDVSQILKDSPMLYKGLDLFPNVFTRSARCGQQRRGSIIKYISAKNMLSDLIVCKRVESFPYDYDHLTN